MVAYKIIFDPLQAKLTYVPDVTNAFIIGNLLTGFTATAASGSVNTIAATDSILQAFQKAQGSDNYLNSLVKEVTVDPSVTAVDADAGTILINKTTGRAWVKIDDGSTKFVKPINISDLFSNPSATGWTSTTGVSLSAVQTTTARDTLRLSVASATKVLWAGAEFNLAVGDYDLDLTGEAAGLYYCYFYDGSGVLTFDTTTDVATFVDNIPVSFVWWSGTAISTFAWELHSADRNIPDHYWKHTTVGFRYRTGSGITHNVQTDNNTDPNLDTVQYMYLGTGNFLDEDIRVPIGTAPWDDVVLGTGLTSADAAALPFFYYNGTTLVKIPAMADRTPFISGTTGPAFYSATGTITYNNAGTMTAVSTGDYAVYWVYASNLLEDTTMFIRPHNASFGSLSTAQASTDASLTWVDFPSAEVKLCYRLIFRVNTGWKPVPAHGCKLVNVQDYRLVSSAPVNSLSSTTHGSLSGRADANQHPVTAISADSTNFGVILSATDTNVQLALDTIDNTAVKGAGTVIDNELVRFDNTTGQLIQGTPTTPPTLSDAGLLTINNATSSTDKNTGCLVLAGGLGVEENINVGGTGNISGALTLNSGADTYSFPTNRGNNLQVLTTNGSGATSWADAGTGTVTFTGTAPADTNVAIFDGISGIVLKKTAVTMSTAGAIAGVTTLGAATSVTSPTLYGSAVADGDLTFIPTSHGTVTNSYLYFGSAGAWGNIAAATGAWTAGPATPAINSFFTSNANYHKMTTGSLNTEVDTQLELLNTNTGGATNSNSTLLVSGKNGNARSLVRSKFTFGGSEVSQFGSYSNIPVEFVYNSTSISGGYSTTGAWTFPVSIALASTGATASPLDFYAETTVSCKWKPSGAGSSVSSSAFTLRITRIGKAVTISIPVNANATAAASSAFISLVLASDDTTTAVLPAWARPPAACYTWAPIINNNVSEDGVLETGSAGGIIGFRDLAATAFTDAATTGMRHTSVCFTL